MIRVAIAGCHRQTLRKPTSHNFASAFCAHPDAEVVGVFDYGERERAEFVECWRDVWGAVPTFDDYEQLLKEVGPDIVCIATRQTMHADQIERAVAAGVRGIRHLLFLGTGRRQGCAARSRSHSPRRVVSVGERSSECTLSRSRRQAG